MYGAEVRWIGNEMLSEKLHSYIEEIAVGLPRRRSALLEAFHVVQNEYGCLPDEAVFEVADILEVAPADALAAASFYTMYSTKPQGKYVLDVCVTLSCSLMGGEHLLEYLSNKLGIGVGETTPDGLFTLRAVQCLGDCGKAPVMMVGGRYYENLTPDKVDALLDELRKNQ